MMKRDEAAAANAKNPAKRGKPGKLTGQERAAEVRAMTSARINGILSRRETAPSGWWALWEGRLKAAQEREANGQ